MHVYAERLALITGEALGDEASRLLFTTLSPHNGKILLNADLGDSGQLLQRSCDCPLGRAGLTEAQARKHGTRLLVGTRPMTKVKRAIEKGESQGFMKVIVDAASKRRPNGHVDDLRSRGPARPRRTHRLPAWLSAPRRRRASCRACGWRSPTRCRTRRAP